MAEKSKAIGPKITPEVPVDPLQQVQVELGRDPQGVIVGLLDQGNVFYLNRSRSRGGPFHSRPPGRCAERPASRPG